MLLGAVQWEHPALTYWRSLLYDLLLTLTPNPDS
jgi:hypothetical protein